MSWNYCVNQGPHKSLEEARQAVSLAAQPDGKYVILKDAQWNEFRVIPLLLRKVWPSMEVVEEIHKPAA